LSNEFTQILPLLFDATVRADAEATPRRERSSISARIAAIAVGRQ
jgi:hypothetical protein